VLAGDVREGHLGVGGLLRGEDPRECVDPLVRDAHRANPDLAARYRETFENHIHLSRAYKDALGERVRRIRDRYGLATGVIEYRPELWAEEEQLELFPLQ